jgi:2-polyprenyl-6-methoxyphenol hydroxylase-like FAD-dependent oxidoreductase
MPSDRFGHAVVVGASIAGLLAARALSDQFDRVTVIERDALAGAGSARRGVPQGRHIHVLLPRGHLILESFFPGLTDALRKSGALILNGGRDIAWYHADGWRTRHDSSLWFLALSRPVLESHIADRVRTLPNVRIVEGLRVQEVASEDRAITGVVIGTGAQAEALEADLIVDATGRGSAAPRWLERLGYGPVPTDVIPAPVTYSSCLFRRDEGRRDWQALLVVRPEAKRTAFTMAVEGNRWLVTLGTLLDEPFPQDRQGFLSFAKSLPVPNLYDAIRDLEPLSDLVRFRFAGSQRRRYERAKSLPPGLIAIGDAVSSFNPVYGQGMTVAALEAEFLRRALADARSRGGLDADFVRRWYAGISKIIDLAWQGVAIEDYSLPDLSGQVPVSLRPLQWYMQRVHQATCRSEEVTEQFYRVVAFMDVPSAFFRPRMVFNVLFGRCGRMRRLSLA